MVMKVKRELQSKKDIYRIIGGEDPNRLERKFQEFLIRKDTGKDE